MQGGPLASKKLALNGVNKKVFYATQDIIDASNKVLANLASPIMLSIKGKTPDGGMLIVEPISSKGTPSLFQANECIDVASYILNYSINHAVFQTPGHENKVICDLSPYNIDSLNRVVELLVKNLADPVAVSQDLKTMFFVPEDDAPYSFTYKKATKVEGKSLPGVRDALNHAIGNINLSIALALKLKEHWSYNPTIQQHFIDMIAPFITPELVKPAGEKNQSEIDDWKNWIDLQVRNVQAGWSAQFSALPVNNQRLRQLGVNSFARPDVGEAYAILSSCSRAIPGKWSFHVAAVIARDGEWTVTLENYNRDLGNTEEANNMWYFDLQGPDKESFHEKHKATVADGITLRIGKE